jgi:hypothetical protein
MSKVARLSPELSPEQIGVEQGQNESAPLAVEDPSRRQERRVSIQDYRFCVHSFAFGGMLSAARPTSFLRLVVFEPRTDLRPRISRTALRKDEARLGTVLAREYVRVYRDVSSRALRS